MKTLGKVEVNISDGIAEVTFFHPKGNSLPSDLLQKLTNSFNELSNDEETKVIILRSEGNKVFCGGASFDELAGINDYESGKKFFMEFANLLNSMRKCTKLIITVVQGKAVGGGVGIVAASDYVVALNSSQVKLSELQLGLGPFVIGPAIERKIGKAAFMEMSIDGEWHDAAWAKAAGMFTKVFSSEEEINEKVKELSVSIKNSNPEALKELKKILWEGTNDWDVLLEERSEISGRLILSDFAKNFINNFKSG